MIALPYAPYDRFILSIQISSTTYEHVKQEKPLLYWILHAGMMLSSAISFLKYSLSTSCCEFLESLYSLNVIILKYSREFPIEVKCNILNAKKRWDHTVELYEQKFIHDSAAAREREIRSIAATSTHVEQPISSIASKFENRINQTAETTLHKSEVLFQPWSVIRFRNPAVLSKCVSQIFYTVC